MNRSHSAALPFLEEGAQDTPRNKSTIPYEVWFNRQVDTSKLRVFGCKAILLKPNTPDRRKLAPRVRDGTFIFVGLKGTRIYRLINCESLKEVLCADVRFDEYTFPRVVYPIQYSYEDDSSRPSVRENKAASEAQKPSRQAQRSHGNVAIGTTLRAPVELYRTDEALVGEPTGTVSSQLVAPPLTVEAAKPRNTLQAVEPPVRAAEPSNTTAVEHSNTDTTAVEHSNLGSVPLAAEPVRDLTLQYKEPVEALPISRGSAETRTGSRNRAQHSIPSVITRAGRQSRRKLFPDEVAYAVAAAYTAGDNADPTVAIPINITIEEAIDNNPKA